MPRSAGPGFRRPSEAGIIPVARENASERKDRGLPSLARRLLPVIAFALVLSLVMAGVVRPSPARLGFSGAPPPPSARPSPGGSAGAAGGPPAPGGGGPAAGGGGAGARG